MNTTHDEQQLIQMDELLNNDKNNTIRTDDINNNNQTKSEIKQQKFILRFFTCPFQLFKSIHFPRFSDRGLRITFLLFITLIGLTSFSNALIVGSSVVQFKQQCPLYASFNYKLISSTESNWTVKIISGSERFSLQSTCDFCTFYNVFTFIYCIMTGFFFVLFNGDQRIVTTNDRCLIIPWFPISLILGLLALINASILTNGFLKFCSTITSNDSRINSCTQLNQLFFEQYPNVSFFFTYMLLTIIGSWFQLTFFIGVIAILTIRLGSSFDWSNTSNNNGHKTIDEQVLSPIKRTVEKP